MTIPPELETILRSDPEIHSGDICFVGTRVPVYILLDYVNHGDSLTSFLRGYSSIKREDALAVLAWQDRLAKEAMGLDLAS